LVMNSPMVLHERRQDEELRQSDGRKLHDAQSDHRLPGNACLPRG
jgi:hypothetical protein